jgi:hypothetical protein
MFWVEFVVYTVVPLMVIFVHGRDARVLFINALFSADQHGFEG